MSDEFLIPLPASIEAPDSLPLDAAIEIACEKLGLPVLGGPSGRGWSYYSIGQRCPHLFDRQYNAPRRAAEASGVPIDEFMARVRELRTPAAPLQIGGLYHALQALYYGVGLGEAIEHERGLIRADLKPATLRGRPKRWTLPNNAADQLLAELRTMSEPVAADMQAALEGATRGKRPAASLIYEAERCFDAHTNYYDDKEDVEPLAVEWLAVNAALNYTCRYDAIMRIGPRHPIAMHPAIKPGAVCVYERKTSAYLSKMATDGWLLDGEILGEILNWEPSGCAELFGPLAAVVVDIVTKAKTPAFLQVVIPADLSTVHEHERWIRCTQGELGLYEAMGVYPKRFTQCFDRWGQCGEWNNCARGG